MVLPLVAYFSVKTLVEFLGKLSFWVVMLTVVDSPISAWSSRQNLKQHERYQNESAKTEQTAIEVFDQVKL
ncbi:uncharacterized protein MONOS_12608 [Monocercomonoides exilis]|uniref:uncharacterized protein n=1 Tax=Monocercomonoides exilis TaxID=2049356 RepID=UPI00355A3047|nr:hypothetical protein MONOS_12608 [Monocercomonoides exilis]|eukprot:MONOS_12608.1-p1 / transcript=MONOS_12608.1 / gene=MONOS_12608 / organism=Monocercomonoides_exilis_PA203 / gene_product=unspecified product / transcript_product=unspecified product / location=Mono_scaffold00708:20218-20664(-) / protein_length=71 / sequence_SO=supercontig / SO=protein_coding / is_pseudo=false